MTTTWWLTTAPIHSLIVPEARSANSAPLASSQGVGRAGPFGRSQGRLFPCLFQLPEVTYLLRVMAPSPTFKAIAENLPVSLSLPLCIQGHLALSADPSCSFLISTPVVTRGAPEGPDPLQLRALTGPHRQRPFAV